jgi:hypothetical protein
MLTGKSVDTLREEFKALAETGTYHELLSQPILWFTTASQLAKQYGLQGDPGSRFANWAFMTPPLGSRRVNLTSRLLYGKGILSVQTSKKDAHSVAFEKGMILDPVIPVPLTLKEWKLRVRRIIAWRIDRLP